MQHECENKSFHSLMFSDPAENESLCKLVRSTEPSIFSSNPIRGLTDRGRAGKDQDMHYPVSAQVFHKMAKARSLLLKNVINCLMTSFLKYFGRTNMH